MLFVDWLDKVSGSMEIDIQPLASGAENVTCASISGRIDGYTVEHVEEELKSLIRIGSVNLVCDLSAVEFVSSAGFKAFRSIAKLAREQDGDLKFCGLNSELTRLFDSVGFTRQVGIFHSQEEALNDFISPSADGGRKIGREGGVFGLKDKFSGLLHSVGLAKQEEDDEVDGEELAVDEVDEEDAALKQTQIFTKNRSRQSDFESDDDDDKTVLISKSPQKKAKKKTQKKLGRETFPKIQPVTIEMHSEPGHFQNLSQFLGALGTLLGYSSTRMVQLNAAMITLCRAIGKTIDAEQTFILRIDPQKPAFRVTIDYPSSEEGQSDWVSNFQTSTSQSQSPYNKSEAIEWLEELVDEFELGSWAADRIEMVLLLN